MGGAEISTATTSVRGTITSRQRLSESSKTLRMSSGALASTFWFAAWAASIRSSSSSGGGGGSKRARTPKGRRTRLTPASSTRANGPRTQESRLASHDSRSAAASGAVLARARAVTSATAASSPTSSTPASGAASATQSGPKRETSNCTIAGGASAPTPAAMKPLSTIPTRMDEAVVSRWVRRRSTRRPALPVLGGQLACFQLGDARQRRLDRGHQGTQDEQADAAEPQGPERHCSVSVSMTPPNCAG